MSSKRSGCYAELKKVKYGNDKVGNTQRGKKRDRDKDEDYQPPSETSRRSNNNPHQDESSGEEEEEEEEEEAPRSRGKAGMQTRRQTKIPKLSSSRLEDDDDADARTKSTPTSNLTMRSRANVGTRMNVPEEEVVEDDDDADARTKSTPTSNLTMRSRANVGTRMNVPEEEVVDEDRVEDEALSDDEDRDGGEIGDGEDDIADGQNEGIGNAAAQGAFNQCEQEKKKRRIPQIVTYNGMSATALKTWLEKNPAAKDSFLATRGMLFLFCFCGIDANFSTL